MKKIVYEIYPLSFKDTTGNGRGDLRGVISKLKYLEDLGVDYLWLTPVFKTPFKDNGYDISDYYQVDKNFGTNEDLKELIEKADAHNLKIMLDMVFNHTSTEHMWFKEWVKGNPDYKDFYISRYSEGKPPTNWVSKFGGSAWKEYKPNNWYLHLFDETQADLNWDNPKVRKQIFEIVDHFINMGVKGFRFDVINLISKSEFKDDYEGDGRKYYTDGKNAHKYIQELSSKFPDDVDFLTVGELSSTTVDDTIQYANKNRTELDSVFTFHHLKVDYDGLNKFVDMKPNIKKLNDIMKGWFESVDGAGSKMATFLNNHDQPRSVSRFIEKKYRVPGAKMLFAFTASLPGIPYIYQGEEIGMENVDFQHQEDFKDVETLNYFRNNKIKGIPNGVYQKSRDNSRTPMQWDSSENAGFSKGEPWIGVNRNFKTINVEQELNDDDSILNFYKEYIKFIKSDAIQINGSVEFHEFKNDVISYSRIHEGKKQKCLFSFSSEIQKAQTNGKVLWNNYHNVIEGKMLPYQMLIMEV
ncbi:alpha,alpha-phosphotrehalase [Mycoplasma todarodis]|uniref:Alpha,alpha-phosphotrehalase n=1 Tax=Mycoplasma todarodis TaxID=1937191 RepID=A0A4V2NI69_9MOLU|nr:alpha,alpha-phosphotrehalase [Mycoplasma todarodis]TCG11268.1 alpha,alpha-phosphotrehalase [Mycoplasma todarodis]